MRNSDVGGDIRKDVLEYLCNRECPCWFPGLSQRLIADYWSEKGIPGVQGNYSTAEAFGDRNTRFLMQLNLESTEAAIMVEALSEQRVSAYKSLGLTLLSDSRATSENVRETVGIALQALELVRDLAITVGSLVRSLHLLAAPSDDYDVSHSEPSLPFSIFVSVPAHPTPTNALRVAESLVHEAMHLQLTLIEAHVPLLVDTDRLAYSPWRDEERPLRGVLHGMYVFRVITEYLALLESNSSTSSSQLVFIRRRRESISAELRRVPDLSSYAEVTPAGTALFQKLAGSDIL